MMGELTLVFPFGEAPAPDPDPGPLGPLHAPRLLVRWIIPAKERVLTYLGDESPPPPPRPPRPLPLRDAMSSIQVT